MSKVYYVKVEDYELEDIESVVRKKIIQMMTREITDHSRELAVAVLSSKPMTNKKWYQRRPSDNYSKTTEV